MKINKKVKAKNYQLEINFDAATLFNGWLVSDCSIKNLENEEVIFRAIEPLTYSGMTLKEIVMLIVKDAEPSFTRTLNAKKEIEQLHNWDGVISF
ncbi:hypothetical protein MOF05_20860 [Bacillus haynesii]|uniref:hypothetical protein n=1 Tax=Bacillus haynesii TaxID=1925021 RepID=UPI0022813891|nr:hypothetical protein [Bacillus haynesii]MCY9290804.1 hypothetical protein [Bacillus haynesii]